MAPQLPTSDTSPLVPHGRDSDRLVIARFLESKIGGWARRTVLSVGEPPNEQELERANQFASERTAALIPGICVLSIGCLGLWMLVDDGSGLEPAVRQTYFRLRLGASVVSVIGLALALMPVVRRYGRLILAVLLSAVCGVVGWSMSDLPPSTPYIHTTSWLVFSSLLVLVAFGQRILVTLAVAGSMWLGYTVPQWHVVASPDHGVLLSNMLGVTLVAIVFGHLLYLLLLDLFVSRQRLEALRESLELRVEVATAKMRALTEQIDTVREDERRWMAHAVHDELGQELTAMRYTLALGQDQVRQSNEAAPATLDDLEMLLDRTNTTMRRIIRRLRPVALDELGFVGALRWLGRDLGKRVGCRVTVTVGPSELIPPRSVAEMLFRAAQEALNNAAKHAEASNVLVAVDRVDATVATNTVPAIVMTVEDDGKGLQQVSADRSEGGLGMLGIRERAKSLGGVASWYEASLGGAGLKVMVPLQGNADEPGRPSGDSSTVDNRSAS